MEMLTKEQFASRTLAGRPVALNLSVYAARPFECACGTTHAFSGDPAQVLRELTGMRLVLACPSTDAVTCVKISGIFRPDLTAQFGCK